LGQLQRGAHQWLVVVVAGPPGDHPHRVSRPVLPDRGFRRDCQSETQEGRMTADVLRVHDLLVYYDTPVGAVTAVNHISFSLKAGERLGLAGESGSGKSTLALSILRLLKLPGRIAAGGGWLGGGHPMSPAGEDMRQVRLARIALIPQGSMNSLNPVMRIKDQLADALQDHGVRLPKRDVAERVHDLLQWVGLRPAVADMFPHELSGGMKQRACI